MNKITVREAISKAIEEEMNKDSSVFILGEEVGEYQGAYKVTQGLLEKFGPLRVIDTPITEHGFTGFAIGAAFAGLRPIVEYMSFNFSMQAIDQIINSAAKTCYMSGGELNCPIVFRGPNGAALNVAAQHSQNYASIYSHIPGLKVIAPYSAEDTYGLLLTSIRDNNPVIFLEHEMLYGETFDVPDIMHSIPFGKAKILNSGEDVTIITFSWQVGLAIEAVKILLNDFNIKSELIDLRSIKPLDIESILNSVKKTGRLVIIEEGWFFSGIGASISHIVTNKLFDYLDAPIEVISSEDVPLAYSSSLEKITLPNLAKIIESVKKVCYIM